jgi:hypothetical protein
MDHFLSDLLTFYHLEKLDFNSFYLQKILRVCVCVLIFFNFILGGNALVFCMQSLPATKYCMLQYWPDRRVLISKCACAVAALYPRLKHALNVNITSMIKRMAMVQNHEREALMKDGRPTLQQTLKNPNT